MNDEIKVLPSWIGTVTIMMKEEIPMRSGGVFFKYMAYIMYKGKKLTYILVDYPTQIAGEWVCNAVLIENHTYHILGYVYPDTKYKDNDGSWKERKGYVVIQYAQEKEPELPTNYDAMLPSFDENSDLPF